TMTLIDADDPACSEGWVPSMVTVTEKVATPEVIVASGEIDVTLPVTAWVEPAGRMRARCPTAISPTWASVTVPVTENEPGVGRRLSCPLFGELDDELPDELGVPLALICWPTEMFTSPATPAAGATRVDWSTWRCAVSTATWSMLTCAWSIWICCGVTL